MVSPVDPNEVRFTGENSFIRLHQEEGAPRRHAQATGAPCSRRPGRATSYS